MRFSKIEEITTMKLISNTAFLTNLFLVALLSPAVSRKFELKFLITNLQCNPGILALLVKREIAQHEKSGLKLCLGSTEERVRTPL